MKKEQFLKELDALLQDISESERMEALQYYEDYFADAGPEMEEQVAKELGSPEQVAKTIKADLGENDGEFSERGYQDPRFTDYQEVGPREKKTQRQEASRGQVKQTGKEPKKTNGWKIAFLILLCILLAPVIFPLGIAALAVLIGVLATIVSLVIAAIAVVFAILVAGVVAIVAGFARIILMPAAGIAAVGVGFLLLAVGLLAAVLTISCMVKIVPGIIRGIVNILSIPFKKRREVS